MKLEKYTKQTGAFYRPAYREVPDDSIPKNRGERALNVDDIVVTVTLDSGETHGFQGDEISQNRLTRAFIVLSNTSEVTTKQWKTKDNVWVDVTANDLLNILTQAGIAQQQLW